MTDLQREAGRSQGNALATAQQMVADLTAFKRVAQSVEAGELSPERLLFHVRELESHFAQLVDQVALLGCVVTPTSTQLLEQLELARKAGDVYQELAGKLGGRIERARALAQVALNESPQSSGKKSAVAKATLERVVEELGRGAT